ncbi:MAG: DNA recombination protein RmuC, partial [Salinimicrobium sediminis]|nr:DNA recombination protein RmuC [Salinimicrobium sediminis]
MTEFSLIALSFSILIFGGFLGYFLSGLRSKSLQNLLSEKNNQLNQQFLDACKEREEIRNTKDLLSTQLTERNSEYKNLQQKLEEQKLDLERLQEKFSKEFENLANRILEQKSEKFTSINKENIAQILHP